MVPTSSWLDRFWNWVDERLVVRRIVLGITLWMTWRSFVWAAAFAETSVREGSDIALIIASVLVPISALQGAAFKQYSEGRP